MGSGASKNSIVIASIKVKDANGNIKREKHKFTINDVENDEMKEICLQGQYFIIHQCGLKGANPRTGLDSDYKDGSFLCHHSGQEAFECGLLDGHGHHAKSVVDYCKTNFQRRFEDDILSKIINKEYRDKVVKEAAIRESLVQSFFRIDKQLVAEFDYNTKESGCSATVVVYHNEKVYVSNVGNSRGILVSRRPPDQGAEKDSSIQGVSENGSFHTPGGGSSCGSDRGVMNLNSADPIKAMVFVHRANRELLQDIYGTNQDAKIPKISYRYLANVDITTLTGDHSVTDYDEMVRLHQEGGEILKNKAKPELANYVRPFKLYGKDLNYPALTISRALGNTFGKKFGIINKPDVRVAELHFNLDKYIIIASDGIWSVFETIELVSLIEDYFIKRRQNLDKAVNNKKQVFAGRNGIDPVTCYLWAENVATYIACLAKRRWIQMITEHNKKIDDITITIIKPGIMRPDPKS